jgi:hypothetical protein
VSLCQVLEELSAIAETNGFPTRGGLTDLPAHPAASHPLPPGTFSQGRGQCWGSVTSSEGFECGCGRPKNIRILRIRMRIRNTGAFTSFFKDKKSKRSYKIVEIKVFLTIFCLMLEGSGAGSGCGSGSPTLVAVPDPHLSVNAGSDSAPH